MDDVSPFKGAAERSFRHEEEGENEEVEHSIADDFGSYGCFMQPFDSPLTREMSKQRGWKWSVSMK